MLRIEHLKKTLNEAKAESLNWKTLCEQLKVLLGETFVTTGKISDVADDADLRLEAMSRRGKTVGGKVDARLLESFVDHPNFKVRKIVARLAPVGSKLQVDRLNDVSPAVRSVAASLAPIGVVAESIKKFSNDDNMSSIYRSRLLKEGPHHGAFVTDMAAPQNAPKKDEFSDAYYETLARKLFNQFDGNLEYTWEELAVKRYCDSMWLTSRIHINPQRLYKKIMKIINDREQHALDIPRVSLREVAASLVGREPVLDPAPEQDVREELESFAGSDREFLSKFAEVYAVKESIVPRALHKYLLSEGLDGEDIMVPTKASSPGGNLVDNRDEKLLDRFVESWNRMRAAQGEPLVLNWSHSIDASQVSFSVILK